ncbi:DNA sulfur modification protein DndB [Streptomyces showdoensis]|uniref:DGQHR domain-containing protein n=1 Tax=Streptomyces showdoensis TaxID=68268 RepID=A0A2P2GEB9_STREW|nr:DNA sulfur modification protein DndB [Streptomyces showdoensis]KKZ69884.1 hypothetical protein VO63_31880 [Streptomyces showdoensis]
MPKIQIPVIGYQQGGRQMMVTAMSAPDLVSMVTKPKPWNPAATTEHGNRVRDQKHLDGIAHYLETVDKYVLGSVVLYLTSKEAEFKALDVPGVSGEHDAARIGVLSVDIGAKFDVGDGQHRIGAYDKTINDHDGDDDHPLIQRLKNSGQPMIIVIEDDPKGRAQDFADLQRNVKAPTASLGQSMDRRQPINRELSDLFDTIPLLTGRVEYAKDNPGKLSPNLLSFKTIRYVSGLLLVGNGYRSPATMDKAVNSRFEGDGAEAARGELREFWTALGELTRYADVVSGDVTVPELREATYLTSAGVLYAIAFAVYQAHGKHKVAIADAVRAVDIVSFDRTQKTADIENEDTVFAGTLISPKTGKLEAGRTAWEGAADVLLTKIVEVIGSDATVPAQHVVTDGQHRIAAYDAILKEETA